MLHTINRLLLKLMPTSLSVVETGEPIDIDVIMDPARCGLEILKVAQVTQGEYGSVSIDRNDTSIRYVPKTRTFSPDQFTYTISDPEGDQVVGTVNLTVPPPHKKPNSFSLPVQGK